MIRVSALERMLHVERVRRQSSTSWNKDPTGVHGDFRVPVLQECAVPADAGPFVATNRRGTLLQVPRSKDGNVRFAFSECPLEDEWKLLGSLYRVLWQLSTEHQWPTRCTSIAEATRRMEASGVKPRHLVVPVPLLEEACGTPFSVEEAEKTMAMQGFITEVDGLQVLAADLPEETALLSTEPELVGMYTRVDDWLGVLIQRANRSVMLVGKGGHVVA